MAVLVDIRLRTIEDYITKKNGGRPRPTTPDEEDVVYRWTALMLAYIRNKWPVDTGTSRDRWSIIFDGSPGRMALFIENPMYYAEYVHVAGTPPDPPLWETLIPEAWGLFELPMRAAVFKAVDRTVRRIEEQQQQDPSRSVFDLIFDQFRNPEGGGADAVDFLIGGGG